MEVGRSREVTDTGQSPSDRTANASQGTVLDSRRGKLKTLPSQGRNAFSRHDGDRQVIPSGERVNRQQTRPTRRPLARRRHACGQKLTSTASPSRLRNRARPSTIEAHRRRQGAGPHLRRGNGPNPGWVSTPRAVGNRQFPSTGFYQTATIALRKKQTISATSRPSQTEIYYLARRVRLGPS